MKKENQSAAITASSSFATITGPDDYASMHEVLTRRFSPRYAGTAGVKRKRNATGTWKFYAFSGYHYDGWWKRSGKYLSAGIAGTGAFDSVCGMVKDDNHRTRGLYFNNVEIPIDRHGEGFKLVTRIRMRRTGLRLSITVHYALRHRCIRF